MVRPRPHRHPRPLLLPLLGLVCLLASARGAAAQDVVLLKNGSEMEGRIVEDADDALLIQVDQPLGRVALRYRDVELVNNIPAERIVQLRLQASDLVRRAAALRGLAAGGPLKRTFLSAGALESALGAQYDQRVVHDLETCRHFVLGKLGVAIESPDTQHHFLRDLHAEAAVARYDSFAKALFLSAEEAQRRSNPGEGKSPAVAPKAPGSGASPAVRTASPPGAYGSIEERARLFHEVVHSLQDQNFPVSEAEGRLPLLGDAPRAAAAFREGDALLSSLAFVAEELKVGLEDVPEPGVVFGLPPHLGRRSAASLPRYFHDASRLGAHGGLSFAEVAFTLGGWRGVNRIYKDLPRSTEQLLHPEKYFGVRDLPEEAVLPELQQGLPAGWSEVYREVLGEAELFLLLRESVPEEQARQAAAGWGGDLLVVYRQPRSEALLLLLVTSWDTEADAGEFFETWKASLGRRYVKPTDAPGCSATCYVADTIERRISVERQGRQVVVLEGCPPANAESLRSRLWSTTWSRAEPPATRPHAAEATAAVERWAAARKRANLEGLASERAPGREERGRYANATLHFAISRPDDWLVEEAKDAPGAAVRLLRSGDPLGTAVAVESGALPEAIPLPLLALRLARRTRAGDELTVDRLVWNGPLLVGGRAAYSVVFRAFAPRSRLPLRVAYTALAAGGRWYLLTSRSPESSTEPVRETVDRILESFATLDQ
ncbi:MAG: hypothetical protein HYZ53_30585 [Planctomycetes bacterium]|nr:hypothetical protein [Planctomycetota bacterium]